MQEYAMCLIAALAGAAVGALAAGALRKGAGEEATGFGRLLGAPCWMRGGRKGKRWLKYRVVAVSHKGGVAVRRWEDESGQGAVWVDKSEVPGRVLFHEPLTGGGR